VHTAEPLTTKATFKDMNSRGGYESGDYEVTTKNLFVPNVDIKTGNIDQAEKFVPKHEIITDNNAELIHTFKGDKGDIKAPIRVVTDEIFYKQLTPSARAFALQEAKKHLVGQIDPITGKPIKADDPKVELFAKSVAYEELKARQTGSLKRAENTKENPAPKTTVNVGREPSQAKLREEEAINNLHLTLNDTVPDEKGNLDVSQLLNGIKFLNKYNDQIVIKNATFNPKTKEFTLQTDKGEELVPYHRLATLAVTANPNTDMTWLKGFKTYGGVGNENPPVPEEKPVNKVKEVVGNAFKSLFGKTPPPAEKPTKTTSSGLPVFK
jgi:hypothetical protein